MRQLAIPRLAPRDASEPCRTASPLELFFDLVFVVAVALASENLHHFETEDHFSTGIVRYLMVFFAIWWAWMNFTWFASAYDSDDWLYRLLTLIQMAGALVMAAGVQQAMTEDRFAVIVAGYLVMRVALVAQWLRAAAGDPERRQTALAYAFGIAIVQVFWIALIFFPPEYKGIVFITGVILELAVPVVAERRSRSPWHAHHIAERYGLFTMIVLGESILASSHSIIDGIEDGTRNFEMMRLAIAAFAIVASMWWLYFSYPQHHLLGGIKSTLLWGYGHYFIFASAAAVSAGIEVAVDYNTEHTSLGAAKAAATLCVPVAIFVFTAWILMIRPNADALVNLVTPIVAVLIVLTVFLPFSLLLAGLLLVGLVALISWRTSQQPHPAHEAPLVEFDA